MKNILSILTFVLLGLLLMITSCNKEKDNSDYDLDKSVNELKEDIAIEGDGKFEKVITKRLVKPDDCRYIVSGTIEYYLDDELVAIIDFGDRTCDNIATKTVRGTTIRFELDAGDDKNYRKVIAEPLVRIEGCDYIVAGIIDFYKDGEWIATIDFGDGTCDNIAIKIWDGGRKEIRLSKD
ncbi:MAG: hypothetical protein C0591_13890 [Marinilabiliales bacterium]|nr:MAG: hypothetical protein C0591_13890 [Marinilabiliales bacterium]